MGQKISQFRCLQQDQLHYHVDSGELLYNGEEATSLRGCCKEGSDDEPVDSIINSASVLEFESLSYMPVRFDEGTTIDAERSHARYSKIVVHSTRAGTQRRSKPREDWLRGAIAGREIILLQCFNSPRNEKNSPGENTDIAGRSKAMDSVDGSSAADQVTGTDNVPQESSVTQVPAILRLDQALTKLSILPRDAEGESQPTAGITLLVDNIQVICPAMDLIQNDDQVESKLTESEKARAVLLRYVTEDTERKSVYFLEETEQQKDRFVQAFTAVWLEKKKDHSMWF